MSEHEQHQVITPEPVPLKLKWPSFKKPSGRWWRVVALVALCVGSSFFGAWLLLKTGWVNIDTTNALAANRQTLVLQQGEIVSQVFQEVNPSTVAITTELAPSPQSYYSPSQGTTQGAGS